MKKEMIVLLIFSTITSAVLTAQTWNGSLNSDWNTAANWTPASVPASTGNVVIPGSVAGGNWPAFAGNVTINSIDMQPGSQLNMNGFSFTLNGIGAYNYFTGATLNNSNVATDIVINVHTGGGGFVTYFRNNIVNDAIIFNITGTNQFLEGNTAPSNQYNGNVSFNINDVLPVYISYISPSQYSGNLTVTRTVAGGTSMFNAGGIVAGNYTFTNNAGGGTGIGNIGVKTSIGGTVTITANNPSPAVFEMYRVVNQTTGGSVNVQNTTGFIVQADTLLLNSLNITGYVTGQYGRLLNNAITGNVIIADDAGYAGGYNTTIRNNVITGNSNFSCNGTNAFLEGDAAATANVYNGNVTFSGNGAGTLFISHIDALQCSGSITINRSAAGHIQAFNAGAVITGNFSYTNNTTGNTILGNINNKTSIGGSVTITANYSSPAAFEMYRLVNQTGGGNINVQNSTGFIVQSDTLLLNSLSITGYVTGQYGRLWNNAITGNVTIADDAGYTGGFNTTIRNNAITGNSNFSCNGTNIFFESDVAATGNVYTGNITFNAAGGPVYISHLAPLQCSGNITINRTAAGHTQAFNAGAAINGNFSYTNNTAGNTIFGNINNKTAIGGTVNILANYTAPNVFEMHRLVNQITGGVIDVRNSMGFNIQRDTLKLSSLSITGYRGNEYGRLWNTDITGNVTIADDVSYAGAFNTTVRNNVITGTCNFSNNGTNNFLEGDAAATANTYTGSVTFNAAGGPLYVSHVDALQCNGNLTINRTVAGHTQAFNAGAVITGNFTYTNNTAGNTVFGNINNKTSIGGAINISAVYTTPNLFEMLRLINQTGGGSITVQNSQGFNLQRDTLLLNSLSITGYRGNEYGRLLNNNITGNVTIADDPAYGGGFATYLRNNIITGNTGIANTGLNILYDAEAAGTGNKYIGNVTYTRTGAGITIGAGDIDEISQNLTLNSAAGIAAGQIKFTGSANGIIEQLGTQPISIATLTMEKTGTGTITLNDPVSIVTNAAFTNGIINSSPGNELIFLDNAGYTGASDLSFVAGPVAKTGNDAFTFPVGRNEKFAPVSISAPSLVTDVFRAQYFNTNAHDAGFDSTQRDITLHHISAMEYWLLDRTNGAATPKVTLSWKTNRSGIVNVMNDLRVARWNGTAWKDEGNGGTAGTNAEGTIQSLNDISSFSPFTLASNSFNNPLPVNFIFFDATVRNGHAVLLQWKTAQEINNDRFEVQRSTDGRNWTKLAVVFPRPSLAYEYIDNTVAAGIYYYRVRQVDTDGNYKYSGIKLISVTGDNKLFMWPNPAADYLYVQSPFAKGTIEIADISGRIVQKGILNNTVTSVPVGQLAKGLYTVTIRNEGSVFTKKFIKQ